MKDRMGRAGRALLASLLLGATVSTVSAQSSVNAPPRLHGIDTTTFDRSIRPQDDFFRFANGRWLQTAKIPNDRATYGAFVELDDRSREALRAILEESAAAGHPAGSIPQKVGDFYASFMDSAAVERLGIQPLRSELERIEALRDHAELPELLAHLAEIGVQSPISLYVSLDARQATRYVVYLSQSGLGLPDRDYYLREDEKLIAAQKAYQAYAETLLRLVGSSDPAGGAERVLTFETALAERHWDRTRNRDREATYNAFTLEQLDRNAEHFSWSTFLTDLQADRTPILVVRQPDYFQALDSLVATTPLETWRDYLTVKLLDAYAEYLSSEFDRARFEYRGRTLQGLAEQMPRWRRGVQATEAALGMQLGQLYVERHFRAEAKERMDELVRNLLAAFRDGIDQLEWMSPATREEAQQKLAKIRVKIGYPEVWPEHEGLEVRRGDLVGNVMRARRFQFEDMISDLGQPIDEHKWAMTPQTVNAYYHPTLNEIVFPAAILQPPFFDVEADDAVNYGAIGAVIGHEISHGFDDQGRRSDGDGNLRDWWTPEDAAAFEARANRLAEQYSAYEPLDGMRINGRLTLGENIGDLSGLAVAYDAYQRSLGGKEPPVINGLTGDQRFFLGWAQIWRTLYRDEALRQRLLTDPHSPGEFRVNGVLRNLDEFHAAFNVQPGDGMYLPPEERVKIW